MDLRCGNKVVSAQVEIRHLVIAGWTGRDPVALERHIGELVRLGVARPASTPIFYRVAASRLTTEPVMEVSGPASSGEVEYLLLRHGGRLWVGVGSDHTDRQVETHNVTVSKQMCEKPVGREFWDYAEVAGHWDDLVLRSFIRENGARVLYQEGPVSTMLSPPDLIGKLDGGDLAEGTLMFCGTLAARGGIRPSSRFDYEIEDRVLGRRIGHGYDIVFLPMVG